MKMKRFLASAVMTALLASMALTPTMAAAGDNIALNAAVESCQYVNESEMDIFLVDDDPGYATKWCATDGGDHEADGTFHWVILDFGAEKTFDSVRMVKASEGERDFGGVAMDASNFYFEVSSDKNNWTKVLDVTENGEVPIYEGSFDPVTARYLKLTLTAAEATPDAIATVRLYDLKVFEAASATAPAEEAPAAPAEEAPAAPAEEAPAPAPAAAPVEVAPAPVTPAPASAPRTGVTSAAIFSALAAAATFGVVRSRKNK